ncbi:MAG: putative epimerase/dehydratase [Syntrophomonadaceae bacterium]|nr:putative epimerase/dehydratase [Bacillota bacterium]
MKLITGGLGFLGSHLARELVGRREEVVLFDVIRSSRLVEDIENDVRIVQGNLGNWAEVLDVVRKHKVNCIYHAGALLSASAEESPLAAYMVNANGTFYVLEAARLFNVEKVVFLSTVATYGPGVPEVVNDDTVQIPTTMYGVTKVFCERLGEYYHRKFGVNFRGVRLPSVIGPGRGGGGASAYSSLIVQEPAAGRPYKVFVDETARIPLLYIKDAVRALVSLGEAAEERLKRRVYNIQGFSPSARDLADIVRRYLPDARIEFEPDPEMVKIVHSWPKELDDTLAREDWGWNAQYTLDKAVKDFIDEFQARRYRYE